MFYLKSVPGKVTDQVALSQWVKSNCVPVVREITFENGEELTEEGKEGLVCLLRLNAIHHTT